MPRHPVRRLAAATILATLAAVTAARAQAPGLPPPPQNLVSLSATASAQVPQDWLTLGNGSNDILELAAHALLQPGAS
ncbi:MAG: hypothetical protein RLZZ341_1435, partial [Pseudomonadota bacterium]